MVNWACFLFLLFFAAVIAANAILYWGFRETTKAGIWPKERFFGFEIRSPFHHLAVIRSLRQRIRNTEDPVESRRYRRWLNATLVGHGLSFFALALFLAFLWLFSRIPAPHR